MAFDQQSSANCGSSASEGDGGEDARRERILGWARSLVLLAAAQEGIALHSSIGDLARRDRRRLTQAVFKLAAELK